MFKKLRDKISEEMKSSPQRLQQFTQTVSDRLQGGNAPEENMFSIGDEVALNTSTDQGFSSVNLVSPSSDTRSRRLSNSSLASDVSFLPRYESANLYHLQSDLETSASEVEDNISQSSSQLGHISKEQILSAYQKSQMRYHKYRGRYTDLFRHYRELERENAKIKAVLADTQDKAIRRAKELKEQCSLEQKAKAHLESALRDEMDEKQMTIDSLKTKIELLQEQNHGEHLDSIDSEKLEQLTQYLNDARSEIEALNAKIQEFKASAIVFQSKEAEYKGKILAMEKDIASFSEREKENNIKLAENKMELHNELILKDAEISKLKQEIEVLRIQEKSNKSVKLENLQSQNNKLIERLETLTQKCNIQENELLRIEKYKIDITEIEQKNAELTLELDKSKVTMQELREENHQMHSVIKTLKHGLSICQANLKRLLEEKQELIETINHEKSNYNNQIQQLRESAKQGLFTLEKHIYDKIQANFEEKENTLKQEFEIKLREISSENHTAAELQLQLYEKENIIKDLSNELDEFKDKLLLKEDQFKNLENNHLELIEESNRLRSDLNNLECQSKELKMYGDRIDRLQANIKILQQEIDHLQKINEEKEHLNVELSKENINLQTTNGEILQKLRLMEEKNEAHELEITENNLLEMKVQALEIEKQELLGSFEQERKLFNKVLQEHNELKILEITLSELEVRNQKLEEKIVRLKGYLQDKENTIVEVNKAKLAVEQELNKTKEMLRIQEEHEEAIELDKTECSLLKMKVQQLEFDNTNLQKTFDREREGFDQYFHQNKEIHSHKQEVIEENVSLAKENIELKKINDELTGKVRIFEEKDQVIDLENSECNLLKLKLQSMEEERKELLKSFEVERELFNKISAEHNELKINEEHIKDLQSNNDRLLEKVTKLKKYLNDKEEAIVKLQKEILSREQEIAKLTETLKLKEEQIDGLQIEKTECGLLEMKLTALEEENKNLCNSFEAERDTFEEALAKGAQVEDQVEGLNRQIIELNKDKDALEERLKIETLQLIESFEVERKTFQAHEKELMKLKDENILLKEEKDNLNSRLKEESDLLKGQVNILKEEIGRLQTTNNNIRIEQDARQEKMEELNNLISQLRKELKDNEEKCKIMSETLKHEKTAREEAISKVKEMQIELENNNLEVNEIKKSLESVEALYKENKLKHTKDIEELKDIKEKYNEICKEKVRFETELQKKSDELQFKLKETGVIEQQYNVLNQENESLLQENKNLQTKIEELTNNYEILRSKLPTAQEFEEMKKINEVLQAESDKLNQEIRELKVRIHQLSSDNKMVTEEQDRLVVEIEEYKAKCEFLESEKHTKAEVERERDSLKVAVTELTAELGQTTTKDLIDIQKDFMDIKAQCERLHLENRDLKAEYAKLEEQCTGFSKIKKDLESQLNELERHYSEIQHEKQLLQDEIQELKICPINTQSEKAPLPSSSSSNGPINKLVNDGLLLQENEHLRDKLNQYKSLDITNKSSIEFYEDELQKMKIKNEKLNRKLDETLVTLNHCTELSNSTEIEYLRNVLYNYMLGKESLVLARVIAAVCKFDPNQTEAVLQKEQQKQTLLGQLGIL
ncbi:hypothetical protein ABEB36_006776 [Hypothenemus hampei]|uniref:GRIP domain-containing protein n=1 Tax=Hypothenemus hampei TaxID=57062 RepID=A0ABD1ERR7_HYPHA